jgi:hypothetical protein
VRKGWENWKGSLDGWENRLKTLVLIFYYLAWFVALCFIGYLAFEAMRLGLLKL